MEDNKWDVVVVGGGPAGISAAIGASKEGARVLLLDREPKLGGILKQCIHDGFGLEEYGKRLTGPEYAHYQIEKLKETPVTLKVGSFVNEIRGSNGSFQIEFTNEEGVFAATGKTVVLATGCRERTSKQVDIHGTRPKGVLTAGTAQHLVNLMGVLPGKKVVILGSGDIGLIMARRLTLEGAEVLGVYESQSKPSGLPRNIKQCLEDFNIPLYLGKTVRRILGSESIEAVEIVSTDRSVRGACGSGRLGYLDESEVHEVERESEVDEVEIVKCDCLILSVGLLPEKELADDLEIPTDASTNGPVCNENTCMTEKKGVFVCGNGKMVYDLVDHVSKDGYETGKMSALLALGKGDFGSEETVQVTKVHDEEVKKGAKTSSHLGEKGEEVLTCLMCPNGCCLKIKMEGQTLVVQGNKCPKGEGFAMAEITDPKRIVTTTVAVANGMRPVVPVRTETEVSKELLHDIVAAINEICLEAPVNFGQVVAANVCGTGVDIVTTADCQRKVVEDHGQSL